MNESEALKAMDPKALGSRILAAEPTPLLALTEDDFEAVRQFAIKAIEYRKSREARNIARQRNARPSQA